VLAAQPAVQAAAVALRLPAGAAGTAGAADGEAAAAERLVVAHVVARLPAPVSEQDAAAAAGNAAPRSGAEELLAGLWAELLGRERIGVADNFFTLGGHSLLATQVGPRGREAFGVELTLQKVFERPTLEGMARELVALCAGTAAPHRQPAAAPP